MWPFRLPLPSIVHGVRPSGVKELTPYFEIGERGLWCCIMQVKDVTA